MTSLKVGGIFAEGKREAGIVATALLSLLGVFSKYTFAKILY